MAALPITGMLRDSMGASSIERAEDRDVWIVRGGWADGIEFTSQELRDSQASAKAFVELITRKRQQLLLKLAQEANDAPIYRQYPPSWPGNGGWTVKKQPEPPNKKYLEDVRERRLAPSSREDYEFAQSEGTWAGIQRSKDPLFGGRRAGKVQETMRVKVPDPAPKKVEHEEPPVLRRKYRKA